MSKYGALEERVFSCLFKVSDGKKIRNESYCKTEENHSIQYTLANVMKV